MPPLADIVLLGQIDLPAGVLYVIRIAAGIGGAIVGWLVAGPVMRLLFRLAFQKPIPAGLLPWTKMGGALLLGFLMFYFLPFGGGPGWGWGRGGDGGGNGGGPDVAGSKGGKGKDGKGNGDSKDHKPPSKDKTGGTIVRERVEIELIGPLDERFKGEKRYYLVNNSPPAKNRDELEQFFKRNQDRLIASIKQTDKSPGLGLGVLNDLLSLMEQHGISELKETPKK